MFVHSTQSESHNQRPNAPDLTLTPFPSSYSLYMYIDPNAEEKEKKLIQV
jgi:hypothetical protein